MKKFIFLALSVVALVPAVSGTAVPNANDTAIAAQSDLTPELLQSLKAQAGSTLPRPL
ncbi:hypothetical protein [Steroidobacter sp.]|uniref:hypothetical protein n=1 Tax=Steroidobacter sp. TaxID=1978227 RepID=UPI001A4980AD|nr:hypothetical protein [Steroidobacter sp.]MBL8270861.1 hypothetical protein [Steroidobacter sp.]